MRRAVVTSAATAAGVVLLLSLKPHETTGAAPVISSGAGAGSSSGSGSGTTGAADTSASPTPAPASGGGATRKVSGDTVNTRYGPVQVQVTLAGSRITTVDVVKYPTQDRRDREINADALPVLNQEAISAQNAQIDAVSGATYTSDGYIRSLQSALDRAKG
ncbi:MULTISPECIES: FMN-binding protein [Kitasatospora]|uniref:FMN-binding protein n=1 Tax=Kitasatospora cathayae TaxID=3004092 RepID=A0ABY7PY85_9ACTN|nr:FMN-binding protein [Kitasatospora sp. HUAS 3-15]WBP85392.1 FMN-binding protein [Kitasatospora sp. HUAS 3-15]